MLASWSRDTTYVRLDHPLLPLNAYRENREKDTHLPQKDLTQLSSLRQSNVELC